MKLHRVGVLSLAKVMGLGGLLVGLLGGLLYGGLLAIPSLLGIGGGLTGKAPGAAGVGGLGLVLSLVIAIGFPLAYGAVSFVCGLINAVLINVVLGLSGGLELELE